MAGPRESKAAVMLDRRPAEVFAQLTNYSAWPRWLDGLEKVERISIGPVRIGSKFRLLGPGGEMQLEITQIMPNELFAVRATGARLTWHSHFALESMRGATWLRQSFQAEGRGLLGSLAALVSRNQLKRNLSRFRRTLAVG